MSQFLINIINLANSFLGHHQFHKVTNVTNKALSKFRSRPFSSIVFFFEF